MSGHKTGKIIWTAAKLLFMAGCYFLAVRYCISTQKTADIVTAMLEGEPLSAQAAGDICEQEEGQEAPQYTCFWGEQLDVAVLCQETGKSSIASVILTRGNSELVMPGTLALMWQQDGCYIDSETAQELFGTAQAAGQTLWCQDKPYTVCGTFESLGRTVVREITSEDEACLDTVSLRTAQGSGTGEAEQFLMRNGLQGEQIEFSFLSTLTGDLLLILPLLLAAGLVRYLWECQRKADAFGGKLFCFGLMALTIAAGVWLVVRHLKIPADMIPSKWSDFSFWSSWWKGQRQNLLRILGSAQGESQLLMLWNLLVSFFCNLLAVFAGISISGLWPEKAPESNERRKFARPELCQRSGGNTESVNTGCRYTYRDIADGGDSCRQPSQSHNSQGQQSEAYKTE